jgi:hypothetical protein
MRAEETEPAGILPWDFSPDLYKGLVEKNMPIVLLL